MNAPQVGDKAPDFSLPYATRDSVSDEPLVLSSLIGKHNLVLAFYPADWSGGCTKEVCTFRDNFSALGTLNADVIGISGDYVYSHHEWAKHHDLPFRLAADHSHDVAKQYGSFNETSGYNRRTVFVVDKAGKIAYADLAYSARDAVSFEKLQAALKSLK
jgi:peroxiredoxin Q/BCP